MFKKKKQQEHNEYDQHLKALLDDPNREYASSQIRDFTKRILLRQKVLPVYPEGKYKEQVWKEIENLQDCLLHYISDYEEWYNRITSYMFAHIDDFNYYKDWIRADWPLTAQDIIENTVSTIYGFKLYK